VPALGLPWLEAGQEPRYNFTVFGYPATIGFITELGPRYPVVSLGVLMDLLASGSISTSFHPSKKLDGHLFEF